jgi:DNA polymerase-3 subunit delta'
MNSSSANALLKTLEEPHNRQLILATCSQAQRLLPTILSRALLIKMDIVSDQELRT